MSNASGNVTGSLTDRPSVTATTTCYYPPEISVSAVCTGNLPVFTITNARPSDGPMPFPQSFTITGAASGVVVNSTFQLGLGVPSVTVTLPVGSNPYDTYTFASSGYTGTFDVSQQCAQLPTLTFDTFCRTTNGVAESVFRINNTSANPMVQPEPYTITGGTYSDSGTFQIPANSLHRACRARLGRPVRDLYVQQHQRCRHVQREPYVPASGAERDVHMRVTAFVHRLQQRRRHA
ncbi:MAG: hypothetical protein HND48_02925 [Chloroflexi bacterium]|nr:hypothetical protein [Chloroflexota bacterium]